MALETTPIDQHSSDTYDGAMATSWVNTYYQEVDAGKMEDAMAYFADGASMRVANGEPVVGKEAIEQAIRRFFALFEAVSHELDRVWEPEPGVIVFEGRFRFDRFDGTSVAVPAAGVCRARDGQWLEQRIYVDAAPAIAGA